MKKNNRSISLTDAFPVMSCENDTLVMWSGAVGVGFEIEGVEQEILEAEEYSQINQAITRALQSLPVGTCFQKVDIYFEKQANADILSSSEGRVFTKRIANFLSSKPLMYHKSYIFITFPKMKSNEGKFVYKKKNPINTFFSKISYQLRSSSQELMKSRLDVLEGIDERLKNVSIALSFMERLRGIIPNFSYKRLNETDFDSIYKQYFNLEFDQVPQGFSRSITNDTSCITIGTNKANIVSMISQGEEAFDIVTNAYDVVQPRVFGLTHYMGIPHVLMTNIIICDTEQELKNLDFQKRLVSGFAQKGQDASIKLNSMEEFTHLVREQNKLLVHLGLHLIVWGSNDKEREERVKICEAAIRRLEGSSPFVETMDLMNLFFALAPCNAHQSIRYLLTTAEVALTYTHFIEQTKSSSEGILFADRQKNVVKVNLFNTDLNNQNAIVIGPTGSGKSFTNGYLITQRFEEPKTKQVIIDIGGTYRNLVDALVGLNSYFEYSIDNPMKFNPFLMPQKQENYTLSVKGFELFKPSDLENFSPSTNIEHLYEKVFEIPVKSYYYEVSEQKRNFLVTLIGVLILEDKQDFKNEQKSIWLELIGLYYSQVNAEIRRKAEQNAIQKFRKVYLETHFNIKTPAVQEPVYPVPKFNTFYYYCLKYYDSLQQSNSEEYYRFSQAQNKLQIETVLKPYAVGEYKGIFSSDEVIDLTEYDLIVFDLDRVKDNPTLYKIVAMLVMELSYDLCSFKANEYRKYIYLDEAWKTISGVMGSWIGEMFRTIRKRNGSITVITQTVFELEESGIIGQAIKANADTRIILRHSEPSMLAALQQSMGFTEHEISLIESIRADNTGREIFIKQGGVARVFYLLTPTQINGLLSSKPVETTLIRRLKEVYKSLEYAMNQYEEYVESGADLKQKLESLLQK